MGWKNLSYWLKGGIIAGLISIIPSIIGMVCFSFLKNDPASMICILPIFHIIFLGEFVDYLGIITMRSNSDLYIVGILFTILAFVFGAIIGMIVEKVKSRGK